MVRGRKPLSFQCDKCEFIFSTKHNLNRHISTIHLGVKKKIKCEVCSKTFTRKDTFVRHMKQLHIVQNSGEENPNYECWKCGSKFRYRHTILRHIYTVHSDSRFECATCGTVYNDKMYLVRHFRSHCPNKLSEMKRKCSLCGNYYAKKVLFAHFEEEHGVNIVYEDFQFPNVQEFWNWKRDMELSTNSSFIKAYWKVRRRYKTTVFRCHRSGNQVVKLSDRSRRTKLQGSKKLNAICTAEIKIRENDDGTCDVSFCRTHIGHDLSTAKELPHLFLHKNKRLEILDCLSRGVPLKSIGLESPDDVFLTDFLSVPMTRTDLLSKKDMHSIEQSCNVKRDSEEIGQSEGERDVESLISLYENSFIYCKKQNEPVDEHFPFLKTEDMVFVFMSPSQQVLLQKHCSNVMAIDEIQGPDPHQFMLFTVLVLDYDGEGIPVAFAFSNRNDISVVNILLTCIKEKVGILQPNTLMTDMKESYFDCWRLIMDNPTFRLFSTWHVKKTWERDLNSKIAVKKKRNEMRIMIHNLLVEANMDAFYTRLEEFLTITDEDTNDFVTFFKDTYSYRAPFWACCYRQNAGVNINLHVEAFHDTLRQIYKQGQKFTSLYSGLNAAIEYMKVKLMETITKNIRGMFTKKLRFLRKAHSVYTKFSAENEIRFEVEREGEEWLVQSFQKPKDEFVQEMYVVRRLREGCPAEEDRDYARCNLVCTECQACAHLYCCTCEENAVKNNMCKHIHAVASTFGPNAAAAQFLCSDPLVSEDVGSTEFVNSDNSAPDAKSEVTSESASLEDLKPIRESLYKKLDDIRSLVNTGNEDVLKAIDSMLVDVQECTSVVDTTEPDSREDEKIEQKVTVMEGIQ